MFRLINIDDITLIDGWVSKIFMLSGIYNNFTCYQSRIYKTTKQKTKNNGKAEYFCKSVNKKNDQ